METALFQRGSFTFHSGAVSPFKIECDALGDEDWATAAQLIVARVEPFGAVEGVPRGGVKLAEALQDFITAGPLLIVDDVLTTGTSMERQRRRRVAIGAVLFSHGHIPDWVTAIFVLQHTATTLKAYTDPSSR